MTSQHFINYFYSFSSYLPTLNICLSLFSDEATPAPGLFTRKKKKYVATYRNFRLAQRPDPADMLLSPWFVKILQGFLVYLETSQWTAETLIHKTYALCRIAYTLPRGCVSAPHSSSWLLSPAIAVSLDLSSLILSCTSLASQPTSLKRHAATACFLSYSKKKKILSSFFSFSCVCLLNKYLNLHTRSVIPITV